jgi:hypothetical protein
MGSMTRRSLAVAALFVLFAAACGERPESQARRSASVDSAPTEGPRGWQHLPPSPLTPRHSAHAFWTRTEALILGGWPPSACLPDLHCAPPQPPPLRDGALFDPREGTWQRIADAPIPLGPAQGAVVDGSLYLEVFGDTPATREPPTFLAYHVTEDQWEEYPPPPQTEGLSLVAAGRRLIAFQVSHEGGVTPDFAYDPSSRTWTALPRDPLALSFDRSMVWTGTELVLIGLDVVPSPGLEGPSLYRAAALDPASGQWRGLPDSEIAGGYPVWFSAGGLVVNPSMGTTDEGMDNPYGRTYPYGGILDPERGNWEPLPDPPQGYGPYPDLTVGGEETLISAAGWVLEVPTGTWERLPRPVKGLHRGHAAVWAGDRLIVWGGVRWDVGKPEVLRDGWAWLP